MPSSRRGRCPRRSSSRSPGERLPAVVRRPPSRGGTRRGPRAVRRIPRDADARGASGARRARLRGVCGRRCAAGSGVRNLPRPAGRERGPRRDPLAGPPRTAGPRRRPRRGRRGPRTRLPRPRRASRAARRSPFGFAVAQALDVNSRHHQALKDLAAPLAPLAASPDDVVEAVETLAREDGSWVAAVQWHPEDLVADPRQKALFRAFLDAVPRVRPRARPRDAPARRGLARGRERRREARAPRRGERAHRRGRRPSRRHARRARRRPDRPGDRPDGCGLVVLLGPRSRRPLRTLDGARRRRLPRAPRRRGPRGARRRRRLHGR